MKSTCPCTSTAWENTKQIALSLVGLCFSVSSCVDARWAEHVGEGQTAALAVVGFTLHVDLPWLALYYGNESILGWSNHQRVAWGDCIDERPCNDLCHVCFRGRKRISIGWKVKMLISKYHCVFTSLELLQNVSAHGSDFYANRLAVKNLCFTQDISREKSKSQTFFLCFKNKTKQSFLYDSIKILTTIAGKKKSLEKQFTQNKH